jgi:hypothetical protein
MVYSLDTIEDKQKQTKKSKPSNFKALFENSISFQILEKYIWREFFSAVQQCLSVVL